jgi:lipid A 3-O-deacylase
MKYQVGADEGLIVTTGRFTEPAEDRAAKLGVGLVDGPGLVRLIERHASVEFYHRYRSELGVDEGAIAAVHAELLFEKPFTPADLFASYFVPRPHLGGSLDLDGGVNYAFAGLTWSFDLHPRVFVEASVGGALQETRAAAFTDEQRADGVAAGCAPSLRESASVGYRLSETWSFVASVERLSNAGACDETSSMTNFGARLGYSF